MYAICITYVNVYLLFMYGGNCTRNDLSHVAFNNKRVLKEDILKSWRAKINISLCSNARVNVLQNFITSYILRVSLRRGNILQLFGLMFRFSIRSSWNFCSFALFKILALSLLLSPIHFLTVGIYFSKQIIKNVYTYFKKIYLYNLYI